ncbi:MAG TPA: hypothetical protein DDW81_08615 [Cryomorphaceae bacterium]|nr:hypothetical protein [Owenweeksia sp.]HBF20148.1 hypothetical protein [Cryomorphaceae bacterium]HCQ17323.1 hypothetical protein [Cryomorphaceae bacterium]|tara:strand:- start:1550 stop:2305 length:756 start_codon:yes stop_codon:yes gene_type:complete
MIALQNITIIGNGSVGQYLQRNLSLHNYDIKVVTRDRGPSKSFQEKLASLKGTTDLIVICVSDQAIAEVSTFIGVGNAPVVHVSGATPLHHLSDKHAHRGIWYPLMSLAAGTNPTFTSIPFCLEATDEFTMQLLKQLTRAMGATAYEVDSEQRKVLHLAAVLAQNFSNHLYELAYLEMAKAGLDFELLKPLLLQSVSRLGKDHPAKMQTGPAVRKDQNTIHQHQKMISNQDTLEIYNIMTQSIQKRHDKEL